MSGKAVSGEHWLFITSPEHRVIEVPLTTKTPLSIGRGERCDIRVSDARLSRLHGFFRHVGEGFVLEAVERALPGVVVQRGTKRRPLRAGARFQVGATSVVYRRRPDPAPPPGWLVTLDRWIGAPWRRRLTRDLSERSGRLERLILKLWERLGAAAIVVADRSQMHCAGGCRDLDRARRAAERCHASTRASTGAGVDEADDWNERMRRATASLLGARLARATLEDPALEPFLEASRSAMSRLARIKADLAKWEA